MDTEREEELLIGRIKELLNELVAVRDQVEKIRRSMSVVQTEADRMLNARTEK